MRNAMWVGGGITGMGEIPMLGVKEKGIAKVIRDIFRNGEQGFFYDPSDLKTQYQDAAGTTAVSVSGQTVGLVLDKSKGLTLGVEKWSHSLTTVSGASTKISDNKYHIYSPDGVPSQISCGTGEKGKWYEVTFNIESIISGSVTTDFGSGPTWNTPGVKKFKSFLLSPVITFKRSGATDAIISNISVKELLGNHTYQTTSAARPILQQTPILGNELAVNGSFDEGSVGWTSSSGGWTFEGGAAVSTGGLTGSRNIMPFPAVTSVGKVYTFSMVIRSKGTQGSIGVSFNDGSSFNRWEFKDIENGSVLSRSGTISSNPNLYIKTTDGWDGSIESVSIKEVTGYRTDQNYIAYDGVDDKLLTNLPAPLINATVLRAIPNAGTQVKYNQTLPMLYEDSTNHSGLIAIDRALTRSEQLRLMTELDKKAGATSLETLTFKAFDNNQEGFVYDPNDLSTMYQDSEGKTSVTAAGQPVGLILDKRKGSATGANLHTTATPMNTTTYSATATRSGLDITVSSEETGYASVSLGMPTVVGKTYLLELTTPDLAGFWVLVSDDAKAYDKNRRSAISTAPGSKVNTKISLVFTASASVSYIHLNRGNTQTNPVTFKDVTCREVLGNHAYQTTSASRPILRQNAVTGANYLEFDGTDDFLQINVSLPYPVTAVAPFDFKSGSTIKCVLSAGASGYLRSTETAASVHSTSGSVSIAKKKVDVLLHELTGDSGNIRTNSDAIMIRDSDNKNTYLGAYKYIGSFSDTHTTLRPAMDLYGMVVIRKLLTTSEEAEIRAHFNKRMGI